MGGRALRLCVETLEKYIKKIINDRLNTFSIQYLFYSRAVVPPKLFITNIKELTGISLFQVPLLGVSGCLPTPLIKKPSVGDKSFHCLSDHGRKPNGPCSLPK